MSTDKLIKDLKTEVNQLEQQATEAVRRKNMALSEAETLEDRNKIAIKAVESEVAEKKAKLDEEFKLFVTRHQEQMDKLEDVKVGVQTEIEELVTKKAGLEKSISELDTEKTLVADDLDNTKAVLETIEEKIREKSKAKNEEITQLETKRNDLAVQIDELEQYQLSLTEDLQTLENEADKLENQIIDQDAVFKARKEILDKQTKEAELKLKGLLETLQDAENKDRQLRESWAEGTMKLEKREKVIRKREIVANQTEQKLQDYNNFMQI